MLLFNLVIPGISYKNSSLWLGDLLLRLLRENRRRLTDLQNCPSFRRCCLMPTAVHPRTNMSFWCVTQNHFMCRKPWGWTKVKLIKMPRSLPLLNLFTAIFPAPRGWGPRTLPPAPPPNGWRAATPWPRSCHLCTCVQQVRNWNPASHPILPW